MKLHTARRLKERTVSCNDLEMNASPPQSNTFLSGVAVLTLSTVLVKLIGLFYKIPMLHYLGSEGMGYFNAAYEWYATLCIISTAGLPLAGSMMIAEARAARDGDAVRRVEKVSLWLFFALGIIGTLLLLFGATAIASLIGSPDTRYALMAVAPTLFFSCLSGAYRGYFQGYENMMPTAISQIIEALGKLILGLGFGIFAWKRGMSAPMIAAWAMLGLSMGVALSVLYLILYRRGYRRDLEEIPVGTDSGSRGTLKKLLSIAIPITVSSSVLSLTRILDTAMILRRLQYIGYETTEANALYGSYTTMAVPIFNLIPSLISSIALALIPTLTNAIEKKDIGTQKGSARTAIRITALLSLPSSLAVAIYSKTILMLLFGKQAAIQAAAPMLSILSVSIFFSGLITTTNAILQAYGHVNAPIVSMLIGSVIKFFSAYFLIGVPSLNIYGAPMSSFLCDSLIVGINLALIAKYTDVLEPLKQALGKPLAVSIFAVGIPGAVYAILTRAGFPQIPLFLSAVPVTVLLFGILCFRFGLIGEGELALLPQKGRERLMGICQRLKQRQADQ